MKLEYFKKDNKLKISLSRLDVKDNVTDLRRLRSKYINYLIYGRTKNYARRTVKNIWFVTEHGYSISTVSKHDDDENYYNKVSNLDTFTEMCEDKITPVFVVNCAADIIENFKEIRHEKGDNEARTGSDVIRPNYRILNISLLFFYA